MLIANKSDLDPDPEEVKILEELLGLSFPALTMSAKSGDGLDELGPFLFRALEVVVSTPRRLAKEPMRTSLSPCGAAARYSMSRTWCTRTSPGT